MARHHALAAGRQPDVAVLRVSAAGRPGLLGAIVASALAVAAATADAEPRDVRILPLARAGAADLLLTGGAPRTRVVIAVPHGWERAGLRAELRWRASPLLASRSLLRVDVDGVPRATARIGPGSGRLRVDVPVRPVTGHRMVVDIGGVLTTEGDPCPPPDAPGAYVRLDAGSLLVLSGTRSSRRPALGSVPGVLVERVGDVVPPLGISLPPRPSAEHVQAAGLVAGAVSSVTGFPGTPVRVATEGGAGAAGATVRIAHGRHPTVAVSRGPSGRAVLTVSGSERELVQAAWGVAAGRTATLTGATARVTEPVPPQAPVKLAGGARLAPGEVTGTGSRSLRLPFRVGESELAYAPARLELLLGFEAPAGGRVAIAINGRPLGGRSLARTGTGRLRLTYPLQRDDMRAGDNTVDLRVDLAAAAAGRCAPLAGVPRLVVLRGSRLTWKPRPRPIDASLALWPFPASTAGWSAATVVIPADPSAAELQAVVQVIAEGARWRGEPVLPRVVVGDDDLLQEKDRHVLALARDLRVPPGLPVPPNPTPGLLAARRDGDRVVVLAFGPDALRPLGQGYFVGRVRARAVVVGPDGALGVLEPHDVEGLPLQSAPLRWRWVVAGFLVMCAGLLVWLFARAVRRLHSLPSPGLVTEATHVDSVLEKEVVGVGDEEPQAQTATTGQAAIAAWRRLAAQEDEDDEHRRR